ncbi:hypothetical protein BJQ94_12230 [Cryobacterium sp. SO2]|uniref:hypothetical protein n=1 Tax=Cryobacterium sp. SO2 TaxID=1897060 RepID=UPI00223DA731|nr:hypothetical protein [Cryobacterium sp. SO2]WEO76139.1 hypothetical protein BJQ94_12230 [Cryobacterium sp. SO2]
MIGVTSCAASPPEVDTTPTASSTTAARPTASATPSATAPSTPTPTSVTVPAAACDTALSTAEYDQFATDGLTFRAETPNANLDSLMQGGGIRCLWRLPNSDIEAWYAQWPSDQATWDASTAQLIADGATESTDGYAGVVQSEYNSALTFRDGTVYYASPARLFASVLALQ